LKRLAKLHQEETGCSWDTSRSHIAKACRRARGELVKDPQWGGLREDNPGGRPPDIEKYIAHLRPDLYMYVMVGLPIRYGADSTDVERFLADRKEMIHDVGKFEAEFRKWYREVAPDEYVNPEMANFRIPFGGYE